MQSNRNDINKILKKKKINDSTTKLLIKADIFIQEAKDKTIKRNETISVTNNDNTQRS